MNKKVNKVEIWYGNLESYLSQYNISIKYFFLLLIPVISFILILFDLKGFYFGIIALVCWIFKYMDLSRIKFKDYEIDFMTQKQVLTDDERKLFLDNYNLVNSFISECWRAGHVNAKAHNYIYKAFSEARLYLPKDIVEYTELWLNKAKKAFILNFKIEDLPVDNERTKIVNEEHDILTEIFKLNPVEIYRKYIKIGDEHTK